MGGAPALGSATVIDPSNTTIDTGNERVAGNNSSLLFSSHSGGAAETQTGQPISNGIFWKKMKINIIQLISATQTILNALPAEQRNLLEAALKNGELDRGILEKGNAFVFSLNYM